MYRVVPVGVGGQLHPVQPPPGDVPDVLPHPARARGPGPHQRVVRADLPHRHPVGHAGRGQGRGDERDHPRPQAALAARRVFTCTATTFSTSGV